MSKIVNRMRFVAPIKEKRMLSTGMLIWKTGDSCHFRSWWRWYRDASDVDGGGVEYIDGRELTRTMDSELDESGIRAGLMW